MKTLAVTVLALATVAYATEFDVMNVTDLEGISAYGYLRKFGAPLAAKMHKAEEKNNQNPYRIVGGEYAYIEHFPYQAGILIDTDFGDSFCGGSLLNSRRVLTAGHCWFDGERQAWMFTVILGSSRLYGHDGIRLETSHVILHPSFSPPVTNDIAMVILPRDVDFSSTISPIALPSGDELSSLFVGSYALASGYGYTRSGIADADPWLSYVHLRVISFDECYPLLQAYSYNLNFWQNLCVSGAGGKDTCQGDSGGPVAVTSNNKLIQIGVVSFGSWAGCGRGYASGVTRITSYMSWIKQQL